MYLCFPLVTTVIQRLNAITQQLIAPYLLYFPLPELYNDCIYSKNYINNSLLTVFSQIPTVIQLILHFSSQKPTVIQLNFDSPQPHPYPKNESTLFSFITNFIKYAIQLFYFSQKKKKLLYTACCLHLLCVFVCVCVHIYITVNSTKPRVMIGSDVLIMR